MSKIKIDQDQIKKLKDRAGEMSTHLSDRDGLYDEIEKMFHLVDNDLPTEDHIKQTISPSARNAALGAVRLLTAAEPKWTVKYDKNDTGAESISNKLERFAAAVWQGAGRIAGAPLHHNIAMSAIIYGEVDIGVIATAELMTALAGGDKIRAERASRMTPLLFDVYNPMTCYPDFDNMGLRAHYIKRTMDVGGVIARWGEEALIKGAKKELNLYETVTYHEYWDAEYHAAWVDSADLCCVPHKLGFIPVSSVITEGSSLWDGTTYNSRQPFLYTLSKSNIWKRENMTLTAIYTWINAIGGNPKFAYKRASPDKENIQVNWNNPEAILLDQGEEYGPVNKQVVDPSLNLGYDMARTIDTQSTIYPQTLGEPLGANAPFSMVSLLNQSGRLPLVPYQRMCSFVTGDIMTKGIELLRTVKGGSFTMANAGNKGSDLVLEKGDLPEHVIIEGDYDIAMPQDQRQNVALATQATQGDVPLLSMRHARETFMNVGQSKDMEVEIEQERFNRTQMQLRLQAMVQQAQMEQQIAQQQAMMAAQGGQPPQGPPQGQPMPPGAEQGIPPEMLAQLSQANQGAQPGLEGLPMAAPMPGQGEPPMPGQEVEFMPPEGV